MYHIVDNTRTVLNIYGIDYSLGYEQSWVSLELCLRMPAFSRTEILTIIVFFFKRNTHVVPSNYKEIKTATTLSQCLRGFEHGGEVESLVQSNLHYPDLHYPDFFSGPVFFMNINKL